MRGHRPVDLGDLLIVDVINTVHIDYSVPTLLISIMKPSDCEKQLQRFFAFALVFACWRPNSAAARR